MIRTIWGAAGSTLPGIVALQETGEALLSNAENYKIFMFITINSTHRCPLVCIFGTSASLDLVQAFLLNTY